MSLLVGRLLSGLALTVSITISLKAQPITQTVRGVVVSWKSNTAIAGTNLGIIGSDPTIDNKLAITNARVFTPYDSLFTDPVRMVSSYAGDEITRDSDLDLNKSTLNVGSSLNQKFQSQHDLQTGNSRIDPPAYQEDLFIKNISPKSAAFRRAAIAPALFIAAGVSTLDGDNDDNYEIQEERNRYIPNFRYRADDYLQHSPIVIVYGLNWLGVEGKNDFANRTAILIKSEMMVAILTFSLKRITAVPRPDTKELTSLPSGHTAQAFAAATFMAREYGHKSIWYSIGAYTVATGVGAMRIMNNRHWISDVMVGAGIGILSTNLAYLTHQYRWGNKKKGGKTIVMPSYDGQTGMVNIIRRIN